MLASFAGSMFGRVHGNHTQSATPVLTLAGWVNATNVIAAAEIKSAAVTVVSGHPLSALSSFAIMVYAFPD